MGKRKSMEREEDLTESLWAPRLPQWNARQSSTKYPTRRVQRSERHRRPIREMAGGERGGGAGLFQSLR